MAVPREFKVEENMTFSIRSRNTRLPPNEVNDQQIRNLAEGRKKMVTSKILLKVAAVL